MIFGIGTFSFIMGSLASVLTKLDEKEAMIKSKIQMVELFANDLRLPNFLTKQVTRKVKDHLNELVLDDAQRSALICTIPKNLRYKIGMNMFKSAIENIPFFQNQDKALIADIVPRLTRTTLREKQIIYKKNDYADQVFFIVEGRVGYLYGQKHIIFKSMVTGSYFGEIEIIHQKPREFSAMTQTDCVFLIMKKNILEVMLEQHPKVALEIKKVAAERSRKNIQSRKEIIDLLDIVELRKETSLIELAGTKKRHRRSTSKNSVMSASDFDKTINMQMSLELTNLSQVADIRKDIFVMFI